MTPAEHNYAGPVLFTSAEPKDEKKPVMTRRRLRAMRRVRKRADHRAILAMEAMCEPDERRKVAACPRCHAWFDSIEGRNAHRAEEHAPKGATP